MKVIIVLTVLSDVATCDIYRICFMIDKTAEKKTNICTHTFSHI